MNKLNSSSGQAYNCGKNIRQKDKKKCIYEMKLMKCLCVVGFIWTERDNNSTCRLGLTPA